MDYPSELQRIVQLTEIKRISAAVNNFLSGTGHGRLVITSPVRGEGKTWLAASLAIHVASDHGHRVLAIDFNWRAPRLHELFQIQPNFKSSQVGAATEMSEYVQKTGIPGLDCFTAPDFEAASQSGSMIKQAQDLLETVAQGYDRVIMDTGPLFPLNRFMLDPLALARSADGMVLVFLAGKTSRSLVKRAVMSICGSGATLAGVVLNQWKNPV